MWGNFTLSIILFWQRGYTGFAQGLSLTLCSGIFLDDAQGSHMWPWILNQSWLHTRQVSYLVLAPSHTFHQIMIMESNCIFKNSFYQHNSSIPKCNTKSSVQLLTQMPILQLITTRQHKSKHLLIISPFNSFSIVRGWHACSFKIIVRYMIYYPKNWHSDNSGLFPGKKLG